MTRVQNLVTFGVYSGGQNGVRSHARLIKIKKCTIIWVLAPILYLGCPAERSGRAVVLQSFLAEAKVSEDDVALRVQQDVLRLQVSV